MYVYNDKSLTRDFMTPCGTGTWTLPSSLSESGDPGHFGRFPSVSSFIGLLSASDLFRTRVGILSAARGWGC